MCGAVWCLCVSVCSECMGWCGVVFTCVCWGVGVVWCLCVSVCESVLERGYCVTFMSQCVFECVGVWVWCGACMSRLCSECSVVFTCQYICTITCN